MFQAPKQSKIAGEEIAESILLHSRAGFVRQTEQPTAGTPIENRRVW